MFQPLLKCGRRVIPVRVRLKNRDTGRLHLDHLPATKDLIEAELLGPTPCSDITDMARWSTSAPPHPLRLMEEAFKLSSG